MTVECVVAGGALLGECPVWSEAESKLYWIDIDGKAIHRYDPASGGNETISTGGRPGSIALTHDPATLVVAMELQVGFLDWETGVFDPMATLEEPGAGNRMNDGRTTPGGEMIVGSMYESAAAGRFSGKLHVVASDGSHHTIRHKIGVTNGQAFSPSGTTYYFADTLQGTVWEYDWDVAGGVATNERLFIDFAQLLPGGPDGACVDIDGCYWIACVNGWAVARITPDGTVDRVVDLPFEKPTMPAFGGSDLATMYVTSIGAGGSRPPAPGQHEPGGLFAVDVGCRGIPEPLFGG